MLALGSDCQKARLADSYLVAVSCWVAKSRWYSAEECVVQGSKWVIFGILHFCCHCLSSQGYSDIPSTCLC